MENDLELESGEKNYASKIKETANGGRRSVGGKERRTQKVVTQRRIQEHVQIDEQNRAAQNGEDETKREANSKPKEELSFTR